MIDPVTAARLAPNDTQRIQRALEVFLIGGAELYLAGLGLASKLYITEIELAPAGDAYFPKVDAKLWSEISREVHTSEQGLGFSYVTYTRKS